MAITEFYILTEADPWENLLTEADEKLITAYVPAVGSATKLIVALQSLSVAGVRNALAYPPESLNTADLPAGFPALPSARLNEWTVSCREYNRITEVQYVVCYQPVGQSTNLENYPEIVFLMDTLTAALDALDGDTANFIDYTLQATTYAVAGNDYWAIVANVTARNV